MIFKKGNVIVRKFKPEDIGEIKDVRSIDREDIEKLFNVTPEQSVRSSAKVSTHIFTVLNDGKMIAILGLMPQTLLSNKALVWMVTTNGIQQIPISFLRGSRIFVKHLFSFYDSLYGIVRNENICSYKWLKWMGAQMTDQGSYHSFVLEKP